MININLITINGYNFQLLAADMKKIKLWIIEIPQRRKLKNIVSLLEETMKLMKRFSPYNTNKWTLTPYQEIQHEPIKYNINKLTKIFDDLEIKYPDKNLIKLDKIILHEWGYFINRIIPLAKIGKLNKCRKLRDKILLETVKHVTKSLKRY